MKRIFYTKDNCIAFQCRGCYIESQQCPALKDMVYTAQYNRSTDTESIHVSKDDLQKTVLGWKNEYCFREQVQPFTEIRFISIDGMRGNTCCKKLVNRTANEVQECEMLKRLQKYSVPYVLTFYGPSFLVGSCVEVNIQSQRLDQLYIFDSMSVLGACAGCKWHKPWDTHDCMPKQNISCEKCQVSTPDVCPAQQMLKDGYTKCESLIKCAALRYAQLMKEKYKDNQLHL